ncbi:WxxW domain, partial [Trinorchestia longiramus]
SLPPYVTTGPPPLYVTVPKQPVCVDGWTPWMNSHTPTPGDWDDLENYSSLRLKYEFCEENMIVGTECQVAVLGTPAQLAGQESVVCSHNLGLQCIDELQAPQHCFDYEIRFKCDCSKTTLATEIPSTYPSSEGTTGKGAPTTTPSDVELIGEPCDVNAPAKLHARCDKFYECAPMSRTSGFLVEKSCQDTFYNPETQTCDWPANVIRIRPECAEQPVEEGTGPEIVPSRSTLPPTLPCEDTWTEWFNISHPSTDAGDLETYEAIKLRFPELCDDTHIIDTQCQFNRIIKVREANRGRKGGRKGRRLPTQLERYTSTLLDYSESPDQSVRCDRYGLQCYNADQNYGQQCQDYAVRFLCSCALPTVSTSALPPYTDSRYSSATPDEQMYNDWCPPGKSMKDQAIPCARICLYYGRVLAQAGHCLSPNDFAPACADDETGLVCPEGMYLRDKASCVAIFDCNCYLSNGVSAPPGKTFLVSDCEVCMCENNELKCDTSACVTTPSILSSSLPVLDLKNKIPTKKANMDRNVSNRKREAAILRQQERNRRLSDEQREMARRSNAAHQ